MVHRISDIPRAALKLKRQRTKEIVLFLPLTAISYCLWQARNSRCLREVTENSEYLILSVLNFCQREAKKQEVKEVHLSNIVLQG